MGPWAHIQKSVILLDVHFEPNQRAIVARAKINKNKVQFVNVCLKAGGEPHELCCTLAWTEPFLLDEDFYAIFGGYFQTNPGWDSLCPTASPATSAAILDTFEGTSLHFVQKEVDTPTWTSPQGFYGAHGHFLTTRDDHHTSVVQVISTSSFPSDHTPIILYTSSVQPLDPLKTLDHPGRIIIPPPQFTHSIEARYQAAFEEHFHAVEQQPLEYTYQHFSHAVIQAAETIFGTPTPHVPLPAMVRQAHRALEQYVSQSPHWWKNMTHMQAYQKLKTRIRDAWDVTQLERKLQISLFTTQHKTQPSAPRKPLYRKILREQRQGRIEPTFMAGVSTPTELHGLIGMDQFRQRHLTPPLSMSKPHIQQYMQWPRLCIPDFRITVSMIRYVLSQASHTTPYHDRLEYKFLSFLSISCQLVGQSVGVVSTNLQPLVQWGTTTYHLPR